ncbi:GDSL esterase/lipase At2g27360-like [Triticum urartu]|uniref:GDSL esterase/lipase At2g27360-like n=1 Tax=Triticum urartu TaxID=4572 RepID=UPI0020436D6A|nr:GDSL esterase/lipase At2g27360-like [Triticum urartu]
MGSRTCSSAVVLAISVVAVLLNADVALCGCSYKRFFAFGDSLIDTGNFVYTIGNGPSPLKELPFGMTFLKHPSGRISDGRVVVDFYAEALGLPLLPPSIPEEATGQFPTGANFAVFGSTALPPEYFKTKYNFTVNPPSTLDRQLASFKKVLARIAPGDVATRALLNESLVLVGEIGGNDYNFWFGNPSKPRETPEEYLPDVVAHIGAAVQEVIDLGARTIVVPGNFPIGCVPAYLSAHQSNVTADYDEFHCLKWYNEFSQKHNRALQQELARLRSKNPGVKVVYADYYGAAMQFVQKPQAYGIADPLVACCGGNGPYHTGGACNNQTKLWGSPDGFASWDGLHMTEKAYKIVSDGVLNGPFADTPLLHLC